MRKIFVVMLSSLAVLAQDAPQAAKPAANRIIGEVKAKEAGKLTVKADSPAESYAVSLTETTSFIRIPPGETDIRKGTKITAADVNVGDRVMARGKIDEAAKALPATMIVVITKTDLDRKQARERGEWQRRGAAGTVSVVTPEAITITTRVANETKPILLAVTPKTNVRRYAPDSIRFNDAKSSTAAEIKTGDQLRVIGEKNEDGAKITAEEIVFGTFRTIPATVLSVDAATGEVKVTDLDSKKPMIVLVTPDSQVKKLPEMMARMIAMQVNGTAAGAAGGFPGGGAMGARPGGVPQGGTPRGGAPQGGDPQTAPGQGAPAQGMRGPGGGAAQGGAPRGGGPQGGAPQSAPGQGAPGQGMRGPGGAGGPGGFPGGMGGGPGGPRGGGDLASMLERLPAFNIADLKPGDALIISSTAGAGSSRVSAITLLAGVEAILTSAPRSAGNINLGSWSLEMNTPQ